MNRFNETEFDFVSSSFVGKRIRSAAASLRNVFLQSKRYTVFAVHA